MANALVVADDYTGAMDAGHKFAANGCSVRVLVSKSERRGINDHLVDDQDVLVVDTDTRDVNSKVAGNTVSRLIEKKYHTIYKKIDSTMRGNIVAEVDAAMDAIDADLALVAPAFPSMGRVTVRGRHFVHRVPLDEAGYNATTSNIPMLFKSSRHQVVSLDIKTVAAGQNAVQSELKPYLENESTIVICDAVHDHHLKTIASGAESLEATVLLVGSGGLAGVVSLPRPTGSYHHNECSEGDTLAVVGSVNKRTLEQLEAVPSTLIYQFDPADAVHNPEHVGRKAAAALESRIATHGKAVVTSATDPTDIERTSNKLKESVCIDERIETALAIAASKTEATTPVNLFLTGGSVARTVLDELSVSAIDLTGTSVENGIPEGYIVNGTAAGAQVVTKAGGFGSRRSIINCLNFLGGIDD